MQIGTTSVEASETMKDGGASTPVAAGTATDTVIKPTAGFVAKALVTAVGTGNTLIWDNATGHTGTIVGLIPLGATVGQIVPIQAVAKNGITVQGNALNAGFTLFWS